MSQPAVKLKQMGIEEYVFEAEPGDVCLVSSDLDISVDFDDPKRYRPVSEYALCSVVGNIERILNSI